MPHFTMEGDAVNDWLRLFVKRCSMLRCMQSMFSCTILVLWTTMAMGETLQPGQVAVSVDGGNNLREFGGPDYAQAKILGTLEAGDWVRVLRQDGNWTQVARYDGKQGFVNSKCLVPVDKYIATQKDPGQYVCSKEMLHRFEADLGAGTGRGRIVLEDVPDLFGGGARIRVQSAAGKTLWLGPVGDVYDMKSPPSPLTFYCHHSGVSWPELLGDLSGDGHLEIIAPLGQSDVSVSAYNRIRWNGSAFVPVFAGLSLVESPTGSGNYVFRHYEGDSHGIRWVMSFTKWRGQGLAEAEVYEYAKLGKGDETELLTGKALLQLTPDGAKIKAWIEPMRADRQ
jgi:hypothetical protein